MARFVFKLQALLDMRAREEDVIRRAMSTLTHQKAAIHDRLRRHQVELERGKATMRSGMVGTIDIDALRMHAYCALSVMREAQSAAIELAGLGKRMEDVREQLVAARTKRRAVELLRERRHIEWLRKQERREVTVLDDLACSACARKELMA
jgi:flagellar FliJ protein